MLTDRQIRTLTTDKPQLDVMDGLTPGFGVRVTKKGRKSFFLLYRACPALDPGRRLRRLTFGFYPYLSLASARAAARSVLGEVAAGQDPNDGTARRFVHRRSRNRSGRVLGDPRLRDIFPEGYLAGTFGELAALYLERHVWVNKKTARHDVSTLKRDLLPRWKDMALSAIGRRQVSDLLGEIVQRGAGSLANHTKDAISAMFNWGIDQGLVGANPAAGMKPPVKRSSRTRYLDEQEIRTLWKVLDARPHPSSEVYRFILLTACRPGEALGLRWEEISPEGDWWTLPASRSKNGKAHRVFLAAQARQILEAQRARTRSTGYVFIGTHGEAMRFLHKHNAGVRELVGFAFNPHDLRRTASTHMARLQVRDEVREAVLNHKKKALRAVYNLYEYDQEIQDALTLWAEAVRRMVSQDAQRRAA